MNVGPTSPGALALRAELSSHMGFSTGVADRASEWRDDSEALAAARRSLDALFAVVAGERPVLRREGAAFSGWHGPDEIAALGAATDEVLLGRLDGRPCFGLRLDPAATEALKARTDLLVIDLRSLANQGLAPPVQIGALGTAKAMTDWHARHRFCANCGTPTQSSPSGWKRDCAACGAQHFPRTDPVAIMLVTRGEMCLLARQSRFPPGMHSAIAGFVEPGETIEDAVRRETLEEAGLVVGQVTYLACQPWPFPSSLMIGCLAEALTDEIRLDQSELEAGRWFSRAETVLILEGRHPDGITCPTPSAIAHGLMRAWAYREA